MVVGFPQLATTVKELETALQSLLQALSPMTQVWVFVAPGAVMPESLQLYDRSVRTIPLPKELRSQWEGLSWIQDYFAIGRNGELLIQGQAKPHEIQLVDSLAAAMGRSCKPVPFRFDGGNIRKVGDTLLVGKNCLVRNGMLHKSGRVNFRGWSELEQGFREYWGVDRVLWLGSQKRIVSKYSWWQEFTHAFQPFYHLDLYLMPLGRGRLAVGEVDFGHLLGHWHPHEDRLKALKRELDGLANQLADEGYKVVRIPFLMVFSNDGFQLYSHLNGLIEEDELGRVRCYLPSYLDDQSLHREELEHLRVAVGRILAQEAIQVHFIAGNFERSAQGMGALHCTTNIISRTHG